LSHPSGARKSAEISTPLLLGNQRGVSTPTPSGSFNLARPAPGRPSRFDPRRVVYCGR
jgi:hypothetical protein